jgi:hypothetical protein
MAKMAIKRNQVIEKNCSTFALFINCFHPQTDEVYTNGKNWKKVGIKGRPAKL